MVFRGKKFRRKWRFTSSREPLFPRALSSRVRVILPYLLALCLVLPCLRFELSPRPLSPFALFVRSLTRDSALVSCAILFQFLLVLAYRKARSNLRATRTFDDCFPELLSSLGWLSRSLRLGSACAVSFTVFSSSRFFIPPRSHFLPSSLPVHFLA